MLKGLLYYKLENVAFAAGPHIRNWGQTLFKAGNANQGPSASVDRMVPSLRCVPTSAGVYPKLLDVSLL